MTERGAREKEGERAHLGRARRRGGSRLAHRQRADPEHSGRERWECHQ